MKNLNNMGKWAKYRHSLLSAWARKPPGSHAANPLFISQFHNTSRGISEGEAYLFSFHRFTATGKPYSDCATKLQSFPDFIFLTPLYDHILIRSQLPDVQACRDGQHRPGSSYAETLPLA
jgi:hypothetical protein